MDNDQNHRVLTYCDSIKKIIPTTNTALWSDFLNVEANANRRVGNLENALLLHHKVLNIRLHLYGSNGLPVANTYQNIGNCLLDSQQPDKAITFLKKAEKIKQQFLDNHPDIASIYTSLGYAHQQKKNWTTAEKYLQKALSIKTIAAGENSVSLLPVLINLGNLNLEQAQIQTAQYYFEQGLQLQQSNYYHSNTALLFNSLGNCAAQLNQPQLALKHYQEALRLYASKTFEVNSIQLAFVHQNIGNCYLDYADMDEATLHYQLALSYCDQEQSPNTFYTIANSLGLCYRYKFQFDKAIAQFESIILQHKNVQPALLAKVYENLANCYFDKQSLDATAFYINKAIATTMDDNMAHTDQARLQLLAAKIKWQQQETQTAVQLFDQLLRTAAPDNSFLKHNAYSILRK
ncbi:MAG: tetratricopeptide repeat protein [Saprospiraceae bacterium]|nr:tetratricopeptide repeat protein [Saprospiraceae bacterium]